MRSEKNKKGNKKLILNILLGLLGLSTGFFIYNILLLDGIENILRYLFIAVLVIVFIVYFLSSFTIKNKGKIKKMFYYLFMIILIVGQGIISYYIFTVYDTISNMSKSNVTYSTSIVVMNTSKVADIDDVKKLTIGMISDTTSIDGYTISKSIISTNKLTSTNTIKEYSDYYSMLADLYSGDINAAFLPTEYVSMFQSADDYTTIGSSTKAIYTKTKTVAKKVTTNTSTKTLTKPFTVLIMGIDSVTTDITNSNSNADSLMLVTFNPNTLNATILSIPRDTYVPISCGSFKKTNKITHSGWYGEACVEQTIENFTGINIDYYVKIDFKGVVDLVNQLGGITVDVPFSFCEQNSSRLFGKYAISLTAGVQTLNGEQTLALARNREKHSSKLCTSKWTNWSSSDIVRGQNQQKILAGIIAKAKDIKDVNTVVNILKTVEKHMDTNISTSQILSLYNVAKAVIASKTANSDSVASFQQLYLNTTGAMIYDASFGKPLSDQVYYIKSLAAIVSAMQVNLGLKDATLIKTFSFSINTTYEKTIIGNCITGSTGITLVPNFIGKSKSYVQSWCSENGITCTVTYTDKTSGTQDTVLTQSVPTSTDVKTISKITISVANIVQASSTTTDTSKTTTDTTDTTDTCDIDDFDTMSDAAKTACCDAKATGFTVAKCSEE